MVSAFRSVQRQAEIIRRKLAEALPLQTGVTYIAIAMQAHLLTPQVVLVTYALEKVCLGEAIRSLRSSVWVNKQGHWQMRYHQGTPSLKP
ncbi:hypothetical protein WG219_19295 [Ectopseudomonas mendocina]|uniref:Uncharacterized protein n=1 Tax=Ectopseudomonas mendocina TaxID=300 RepID=A0ABZ2RFS0_ECTME